jgi:hypothetical protein
LNLKGTDFSVYTINGFIRYIPLNIRYTVFKKVIYGSGQPCTYTLQKLNARMKVLTPSRDKLQATVTRLASSGKDFKALESASLELAALSEELDEAEMRWLELAEIAGEI